MEHTYKMPKMDISEEVFKEVLTKNISEIQKKIKRIQRKEKQAIEILDKIDNRIQSNNKKYKDSIILIIVFSCLWIGTTTFIQAIINPKMTQTELFLNIPNSIILNFDRT